MNLRAYRTFQALILAGLGVYLLALIIEGEILLFASQRLGLLVVLAAVSLVLLAQFVLSERPAAPPAAEEEGVQPGAGAQFSRDAGARAGWRLWLLALPLLVGLLAPLHNHGSSGLWARGVYPTAGLLANAANAAAGRRIPPQQRSVLDWLRVWQAADGPVSSEGQPADITGFVYHDPRLGANRFLIGREVIAAAAADAAALGLVVEWPQAGGLADGQWLRG